MAQHPTTPTKTDFQFAGFKNLNSTPIPDEFFDMLAVQLSEAELRVLLYIMRRTFGFKKTADAISLSQLTDGIRKRDGSMLDHGTGLSRPSVLKAINGLQTKGIIQIEKRTGFDGRNEVSIYSLRFQQENAVTSTTQELNQQPFYSNYEYFKNNHNPFPAPDPHLVSAQLSNSERHQVSVAGQERSGAVSGDKNRSKVSDLYPVPNRTHDGVKTLNQPGKGSLPTRLNTRSGSKDALPGQANQLYQGSQGETARGVKMLNPQHDSSQTFRNQETVQQPLLQARGSLALQGVASDELEPVEVQVDGDLLYINFRKLVLALTALGLSEKIATALAYDYPEAYLWEKIELTRQQIGRSSHQTTVRNTAGYLRRAIEENYQPRSASDVSNGTADKRFPFALALTAEVTQHPEENQLLDTAPLPPIYRTARLAPTKSVTMPLPPAQSYPDRPATSSQPSSGAEGQPGPSYSPMEDEHDPQTLYNDLWEQIKEDLAGRYRLASILPLLEGAWLWLAEDSPQVSVVLASPWQERELSMVARSALGMAIRQRLGPGYTLRFDTA